MEIGDVVRVTDDSWSVAFNERQGFFRRRETKAQSRLRQWKVIDVDLVLPIDNSVGSDETIRNDTLLQSIESPGELLFTSEGFFQVVKPEPETAEITVPQETKKLTITFE